MPVKLDIDGVTISKADVTWKDEITGGNYEISDFDLKTGRISPGIPTKFSLGASVKGNQPKLEVKVSVEGLLNAELERQLFSVTELSVNLNGQAAGRALANGARREAHRIAIANRRIRRRRERRSWPATYTRGGAGRSATASRRVPRCGRDR